MKVNSNLEVISKVVANNLDTFDMNDQNIVINSMISTSNSNFIIDGKGGEGKTTFAFRIAAGLGLKDYLVFFMDLRQQYNSISQKDIEELLRDMDSENSSKLEKTFLFIDNPFSNVTVLSWIHDAVSYHFTSINVVLVERVNRLKMLFNSNINEFPEWEDNMFRIHLRNTLRKRDNQSNNKNELWINRSFAMRKNIIEKMVGTIRGINVSIVKMVYKTYLNNLLQEKNVTLVEAMFYFKIKYNEILKERNLPISKSLPLDWDEWKKLISKNHISNCFGYGFIAAPYLFSYQFPVNPIIQENPDFLSILNTMNKKENTEPLIFDRVKNRLYPKHEAVAEMFFHFNNIDDITEYLITNFCRFSTSLQKVFIFRVMQKQYIMEKSIGGFSVDFVRLLDVINCEKIFDDMEDQFALINYWIHCKRDKSDIDDIRELASKYPDNKDILKEYIYLCTQYNFFDECENALKNFLALDGKSYGGLRFVAETYRKFGNVEQSIKYYYAAAKRSPNRLNDYKKIEKIILGSGTKNGLSKIRQRIIEMDHRNIANFTRLDDALIYDGKIDERFKNYEYAQYYFPKYPWGYEKMIELSLNQKQYRKAFRYIKKYYFQIGLQYEHTQINLLHYLTLICWCSKEFTDEIKQMVLKNEDNIVAVWKKTNETRILCLILTLCIVVGVEHILLIENESFSDEKKDLQNIILMFHSKSIKSLDKDLKALWPTRYLNVLFKKNKVFFRNDARYWHLFIKYAYYIYEKLINNCNRDPNLEKILYLDMKTNIQSWMCYAMQRFIAVDQIGLVDILNCVVEYEIIFFLKPFHWFENYFGECEGKKKELEKIVAEKYKILTYIHKIYSESANNLLECGQVEQANQLLEQIVKRYPKTVEYLTLYILSFIKLNECREVKKWYLYTLNISKGNISNRLFNETINYYIRTNDWDRAEEIIHATEKLISDRKNIDICKMQFYFKRGDLNKAEEIACAQLNTNKPSIKSASVLYQIYRIKNDWPKVQEIANYVIKHFQGDIPLAIFIDSIRITGEKEKALKMCIDKINADNPYILKMGKEICCECGQYKRAMKFFYCYCKYKRTRKDLEYLTCIDILEGLYTQRKIGVLKKILKNLRKHPRYDRIVQDYFLKISNLSP